MAWDGSEKLIPDSHGETLRARGTSAPCRSCQEATFSISLLTPSLCLEIFAFNGRRDGSGEGGVETRRHGVSPFRATSWTQRRQCGRCGPVPSLSGPLVPTPPAPELRRTPEVPPWSEALTPRSFSPSSSNSSEPRSDMIWFQPGSPEQRLYQAGTSHPHSRPASSWRRCPPHLALRLEGWRERAAREVWEEPRAGIVS